MRGSGRMANAVRIAVTGTSEDAQKAIKAADKAAKEAASSGLKDLKGALISLAPAAIPIAASLAPLAAHMGAGAVAAGAFGAALIPQVKSLTDVASAQDKVTQAQLKYGVGSKQARAASDLVYQSMKGLPPATKQSAAAFLILRDSYKAWSDGLAKDTMPVFTKSLGVANALLPKTSGLVKGASTEFNRLITALGGAVATPGFDSLDKRFTSFATGSLRSLTNEVIHLSRSLSEGSANGPAQKFMDYVHKTGPLVKDTLKNLAEALLHIGEAASNAGPGMLAIVNALAKMITAIPPAVLTRLLQLYTATRLIGMTSSGIVAAGRALEVLAARAVLAGRAFASASFLPSVAGLSAAFATLSTTARLGIGIGLVAAMGLTLKHFVDEAGKAKLSTDQVSSGFTALAAGGKAADTVSKISSALDDLNKNPGGGLVKDNSVLGLIFGGSAKSSAEKTIKSVDQALADMVKNGNASEAAAALTEFQKESGKKIPTDDLKKYTSAQKDAAFEVKLAAQSLGLFGEQSIAVQKKLDSQKQSAQGLQQAIFDLNDAYRSGLDTMSDYQQAIDDAAKAIKGHGNALHFTNGELDLNTQASRDAYAPLSKLASTAQAAAAAAVTQGKGQDYANKILIDAHGQLVKAGEAMGLTSKEANKLADNLDNIKDPKIKITGTTAVLNAAIVDAKKKLASMPATKTAALKANAAQLYNVIRDAQARIDALHGKSVDIHTTYTTTGTAAHEGGGYAAGGLAKMGEVAWVGEQGPELMQVTPSGTRIINNTDSKALARKSGVNIPGYASGTSAAEHAAATTAMGSLGVSYFGQVAGYRQSSFQVSTSKGAGSVSDLVNTLNNWKGQIRAATHGAEESKLVSAFDKFGAAALKNEAKLLQVSDHLTSARDSLASLKDSFNQLKDSVASSVTAYGSIAKGGSGNSLGMLETLQGSVDNANKFASDLAALKKKGLNSQSLSELAGAGVDGGLSAADQLAGASPDYIKRINALEKQLQAAGAAAGSTTANSVYGQGIAQAQGIVDGLAKQQATLNKIMANAVVAMANQLKKSLSGKAAGGPVGAAAMGGPRNNLTWVGEAGPELVNLAPGSSVRPHANSMGDARGPSGYGAPINLTVMIGGVELGGALIDPLRHTIKNQGGNVQIVLGQRGK